MKKNKKLKQEFEINVLKSKEKSDTFIKKQTSLLSNSNKLFVIKSKK